MCLCVSKLGLGLRTRIINSKVSPVNKHIVHTIRRNNPEVEQADQHLAGSAAVHKLLQCLWNTHFFVLFNVLYCAENTWDCTIGYSEVTFCIAMPQHCFAVSVCD